MTPNLETTCPTPDDGIAQVLPLPPELSDKILSSEKYRLVQGFATIAPLIMVGTVGLLVFAKTPQLQFGSAAIAFLTILCAQPERCLRRVALREMSRRPVGFFDPRARNSRFVGLVPKSNWNDKTLMDKSVDVGFIAPCPERGELLFEGNTERFRIPGKAILKCELDSYSRTACTGHGTLLKSFYFVVVTVRVSEAATSELPFRVRAGLFGRSEQKEREVHYRLLKEINALKSAPGA